MLYQEAINKYGFYIRPWKQDNTQFEYTKVQQRQL